MFKVLRRPLNSPHLDLIEHLWDVIEKKHLIDGFHISQLQGHKAFAADVLVSDTTGQLHRSVESMSQQVRVVLVVQGELKNISQVVLMLWLIQRVHIKVQVNIKILTLHAKL